jgi:hypothetical protein
MLTTAQKNNINNLNIETCLEIMHECAERVGCVSVKIYCEITGEKRRTVYQKMNDGRIKHFNLMPFVNI